MEAMGSVIRRVRLKKGLTQAKLAHLAGVTSSSISKWESGRALPGGTSLAAVCQVLGLELDATGKKLESKDKPSPPNPTKVHYNDLRRRMGGHTYDMCYMKHASSDGGRERCYKNFLQAVAGQMTKGLSEEEAIERTKARNAESKRRSMIEHDEIQEKFQAGLAEALETYKQNIIREVQGLPLI